MIISIVCFMTFALQQPDSGAEKSHTDNSARIDSIIMAIEQGLKYTEYSHRPRIDVKNGIYVWDCSIMATWIINQVSPRARKALAKEKPLARDFYQTIKTADTLFPRNGWLRITKPSAIAPGDVFAWLKPEMFRERPNTGHVGFVIGKPRPHPSYTSVWVMRIADATRELHENDSRPVGGEGGFGTATIAVKFDDQGAPVAYGWYGASQDTATYVPTSIVFGRVVKGKLP